MTGPALCPSNLTTAAPPLATLPSASAPVVSSAVQSVSSLPTLASPSSTLQAIPSGPVASLQPLPAAGGSASLQPLPAASSTSADALQPLPTDPAAIPPGGIAPPASSLDSTLNLGGVVPTPVAGPDGAFGGEVGAIPLPPSAAAPGAPQAAIDPAATITPGVAQAGAEQVNIDVSGLTLNSQLNLGNLAQATAISAT